MLSAFTHAASVDFSFCRMRRVLFCGTTPPIDLNRWPCFVQRSLASCSFYIRGPYYGSRLLLRLLNVQYGWAVCIRWTRCIVSGRLDDTAYLRTAPGLCKLLSCCIVSPMIAPGKWHCRVQLKPGHTNYSVCYMSDSCMGLCTLVRREPNRLK